jgi:hypothetical protein
MKICNVIIGNEGSTSAWRKLKAIERERKHYRMASLGIGVAMKKCEMTKAFLEKSAAANEACEISWQPRAFSSVRKYKASND